MAESKAAIRIGLEGEQQVVAGLKRVQGEMGGLGSAADRVKGALAAVGVGLSFGELISQASGAVKFLSELDDAAEAAGSSVENLSKVMGVAAQAGKGLDDIVGLTTRLQRSMIGVEQDTGKAAAAFKAMGLNLSAFDDSTQALIAFAAGLDKYADGANKTQLAIAALGPAGARAIPFLKDLAQAGELQARVTTTQAAEAEKLEKAFIRLKYESQLARAQFASEWIPTLTALIEKFNAARKAGLDMMESLGAAIGLKGKSPEETAAEIEKVSSALEKQKKTLKELNDLPKATGAINEFLFGDKADLEAGIKLNEVRLAQLKKIKQAQDELAQARRNEVMDSLRGSGYGPGKDQAPGLPNLDAAKSAATAYKALTDEIAKKNAENGRELDLKRSLTDAEKLEVDLLDKVTKYVREHGAAREEGLKSLVAEAVARQRLVDAQRQEVENRRMIVASNAEALKAQEEYTASLDDENEAIRKQVAEQRKEYERLGESKLGILLLSQKELDIQIAIAKGESGRADINEVDRMALQERVRLLEELRAGLRKTFDKQQMVDADEAVAESAKREVEEFQKAADDINRALTDSLFRAAEAGKGFFETLRTSIKGMFNNIVLKPIIQASLAPVSGALQAFVSGVTGEAGVGSTGSSGSSLISTASNLKNMYELGQKAITFLGLGGVSSAGLASAAALTSGSALGSGLFSLSIPSVMTAAPAAMGGSIMGLSALGTGTMGLTAATTATTAGTAAAVTGTTAASSASILAAIPVWGWAAMAATAAAAIFGGSAGAPKGGGSATIGASGLVPGATRLFSPNTADEFAATTAGALYDSFSALATQFGGAADKISIALGFDTDPGGKAQNRIASYVQNALGEVKFLQSGRDVGRDQATLEAELATEGKRVILAALQNADLQGGYAEILARLDPATAAPDAITNLLALAASLKAFSDSMTLLPESLSRLSELSATAVEQLANASGGLDALTNNLKTYYSKFFTPQEQQATLTRQLGKLLGDVGLGPDLSLPTAEIAAWYRTTVDGIDLQTEAGRNQYAAVLALAGPLADWIDATNALTPAATAAATATDTLRRSLETERDSITGDMSSLTNEFGDLSQTLAELENPTKTVAQRFLDLGTEIRNLQTEMESILGTGGLSLTQQLSAAAGVRGSIAGAKGTLQDQVASTITQGFLDRGDKAGAARYLKTLEDWLIAAIPTADDPAAFASRAASLLFQRKNIEASITTDDQQRIIDGERTARELRITTLNDEIDRLRTLEGIAKDINATLYDLRTGSLSALAPQSQVAVAQTSFDSILSAALGGDTTAAGMLSRSAGQYLTELQSFSASGGGYAGEFLRVTGALEQFGMSLASVPTQLSVAENQLTTLQSVKDATVTTADNSGEILTGLDTIGDALDGALSNRNTQIEDLVAAINAQIEQWTQDRDAAAAQFNAARERWTALDDRLQTVEDKLTSIDNNITLVAAQ